jgi:hypothetical protein
MTQRLVSDLFPSETVCLLTEEIEFRSAQNEVNAEFQTGPEAFDSVPARRFMNMPEQDLSVWTPSLMIAALVRALRDSFRPAELRYVAIRKDDRA